MFLNQPVTGDQKALLERILESSSFHKSTRSRQLLEYLGHLYFEGNVEAIHETKIGMELFERGEDFDPSADSIVRASMRQLRARLADYYASDGADEAWELKVPKGDYRLRFVLRSAEACHADIAEAYEGLQEEAVQLPPGSPEVSMSIRADSWKRVRSPMLRYGALAFFAGAMFFLGSWLQPVSPVSPVPSAAGATAKQHSLMEHFLDNTKGAVFFVPSDSVVNLIQSFSREVLSFEDYHSRRAFALDHPASRRDPSHWEGIVSRELLNIGDASIVLHTVKEHAGHSSRLAFRQSRDLQSRDLRAGNFVFLGSRNANPWVQVFEPDLNFQFQRAANGKPARWRNMEPRKGESDWYPPLESSAADQAAGNSSYAHVAMVPNLSHSGSVLMIGGVSQPDTEAAGEFVLSPASARTIAAAMEIPDLAKVPFYEMVLRTEKTGNTWRVAEVVAFRILRTQISHVTQQEQTERTRQ